jgi:hypothetical protein
MKYIVIRSYFEVFSIEKNMGCLDDPTAGFQAFGHLVVVLVF